VGRDAPCIRCWAVSSFEEERMGCLIAHGVRLASGLGAHSWGGGADCMGKPPIPPRDSDPTVSLMRTHDVARFGARSLIGRPLLPG